MEMDTKFISRELENREAEIRKRLNKALQQQEILRQRQEIYLQRLELAAQLSECISTLRERLR